jgi:O-antigen ligase
LNMLFEWLSLGLLFFLARQLIRAPREMRAMVAIMVALAVVMAAYGFHQMFVSFPATREAYAANPDESLRAAGQWFPPGSPARQQFEDRLKSTEPFATFALANSLAAFLATWLVFAVAILFGRLATTVDEPLAAAQSRRRWLSIAGLAACAVAIVACLILTKSRSAYVAAAVGIVLYPWFDPEFRRRWLGKKSLMAAIGALVVLVAAAIATKGVDVQVLTEASKSLGYRAEYWRSTLVMIAHRPWLGVGPGNFQDFYTQFKLPQASEEIRDPHNFLLEVWATAGTFAFVALNATLVLFGWRTWRAWRAPLGDDAKTIAPPAAVENESARNVMAMVAGAAVGFVLAFVIAPSVRLLFSEQQLAGGLVVGAGAIACSWGWIMRGTLSPRLPALGVLVLAIHLLASGGIVIPGVADSWWLLLALGFNVVDRDARTSVAREQRLPAWTWGSALLLLVGAAGVSCYLVAFRPVVRCHAALQRAMEEPGGVDQRINLLVDAAEADPLSPEPWWMIAELEYDRLLTNPGQEDWLKRFVNAISRVLDLRPYSSAAWRQCGRWYYELYARSRELDTGNPARVCFDRAVALYPNMAELRGEYALALLATGNAREAKAQMDVARRLDQLTPHGDKKLSPQMVEQLKRLEASLKSPEAPATTGPASSEPKSPADGGKPG